MPLPCYRRAPVVFTASAADLDQRQMLHNRSPEGGGWGHGMRRVSLLSPDVSCSHAGRDKEKAVARSQSVPHAPPVTRHRTELASRQALATPLCLYAACWMMFAGRDGARGQAAAIWAP